MCCPKDYADSKIGPKKKNTKSVTVIIADIYSYKYKCEHFTFYTNIRRNRSGTRTK